jgi:DNA-binding NarL/FixJ family response regulator
MARNFTPREKMLLRCIAMNWSTQKCAEEMGIKPSTVAVMRYNLRRALGDEISGPHGLYRYALENKENLK